jgi:DNA-nicking Smr family endonuclease
VKESISSFVNGRPRRLTAEEIALWLTVAKTVAPRPGSLLPPPVPAPVSALESSADEPTSGAALQSAEPVPGPEPIPAARKETTSLAPLERRLRQKLARGQAAPDAVIDLHGLRRQEAFLALRQFLSRAQRDGARLVLVVTGKGERGSQDSDAGVLRRNVPQWLRSPDYHAIIIGFEEAGRPHGGAGALYVRLRRRDRAPRGMQSP